MEYPRQKVGSISIEQKTVFESMAEVSLRATYAHVREDRNSAEQDPGLQARFAEGKSIEDWKIERLENFVCSTQAVTSMNSYKAQKTEAPQESARESTPGEAVWQAAKQILHSELCRPAYETWIAPCRMLSLENQVVTLATGTEFSLSIIDRRYGSAIKRAFEQVLGQPIRLRYQAIPELEQPQPVQQPKTVSSAPSSSQAAKPKYPLAQFQNPTNNPQVAILLERYGDIRGVMKNHPFFKRIQLPVDEGGWGTDLAGLIYFAKEYTLERVLWAAKQAKEYQGADSRGAVFAHAIRKGLEAR